VEISSTIRNCIPEDARSICNIYNHYVRETVVTFEESTALSTQMGTRISNVVPAVPRLI
jgi:phosphinothricin acetyltransferase